MKNLIWMTPFFTLQGGNQVKSFGKSDLWLARGRNTGKSRVKALLRQLYARNLVGYAPIVWLYARKIPAFAPVSLGYAPNAPSYAPLALFLIN
ncbi:hypothetical protein [Falsibacillus pallidus]|uniref:hypothetical protein n=1 Tax=Falsibacillus pallidus TaxID=493781 RepID=UPI003D968869